MKKLRAPTGSLVQRPLTPIRWPLSPKSVDFRVIRMSAVENPGLLTASGKRHRRPVHPPEKLLAGQSTHLSKRNRPALQVRCQSPGHTIKKPSTLSSHPRNAETGRVPAHPKKKPLQINEVAFNSHSSSWHQRVPIRTTQTKKAASNE